MNPQLIAGGIAFVLGLLCGFAPTRYYYAEENTKRILEEKEASDKARKAADQQRKESEDAWAKNLEQILADKDAYQRCVAAGRCGAVVRVLPAYCPTRALPASAEPDEASPDTVPADAGLATDCAVTTGMLNALQADIERQPLWGK